MTAPSGAKVSAATIAKIRGSFARQGLMRLLEAELTDITAGRVTISLAHRPEITQQHGHVHAGATTSIADTAGGYAAMSLLPATSEIMTVELKLNLLAPAASGTFEAVGTVLRSGRTLTVTRLEVFLADKGGRALTAAGQQTLIRVDGDPSA